MATCAACADAWWCPVSDPDRTRSDVRLAVVGPCSSGKTVLGERLKALGFTVRQPAQEHTIVADMWQRLSRPDLLIFLDVDYPTARQRRPHIDGGPQRVAEQQKRLAHARQHADLVVDTRGKTPEDVYTAVADFLKTHGLLDAD